MIIGITKLLILFPFIPYLIFVMTSKSKKMAHVYNGLVVALANFLILNYLLSIGLAILVFLAYVAACFFFAYEHTSKKRTPKRFVRYGLLYLSKLGMVVYLVLVIIGTIVEM